MAKWIKRMLGRESTGLVIISPAKSVSVSDFVKADFIIPSSGGSTSVAYTGSKEDVDRFVGRVKKANPVVTASAR